MPGVQKLAGLFYFVETMTDEHRIFSRLDRIENKVDGLVDVVAGLARIEERSANQNDAIRRIGNVIDMHEERITTLEKNKSGLDSSRRTASYIITLLFTIAGIAIAIAKM